MAYPMNRPGILGWFPPYIRAIAVSKRAHWGFERFDVNITGKAYAVRLVCSDRMRLFSKPNLWWLVV